MDDFRGTVADEQLFRVYRVFQVRLAGQVAGQSLFKLQAIGVRVGRQFNPLHGLPNPLRRSDGADAGAKVQHIFGTEAQGP